VARGRVIESHVSIADVAPTALEALGVTRNPPNGYARHVAAAYAVRASCVGPQPQPDPRVARAALLIVPAMPAELSPSMMPFLAATVTAGRPTGRAWEGVARAQSPCTRLSNLAGLLTAAPVAAHGVCSGQLDWVACEYGPAATPPRPQDLLPLHSVDTMHTARSLPATPPSARGSDPRYPTIFQQLKRTAPGATTLLAYRSVEAKLLSAHAADAIDRRVCVESDAAALAALRAALTEDAGDVVLAVAELTSLFEAGEASGYESPEFAAAALALDAALNATLSPLLSDSDLAIVVAADVGKRETIVAEQQQRCHATTVRVLAANLRPNLVYIPSGNYEAAAIALTAVGGRLPTMARTMTFADIAVEEAPARR
jgi:hypothetical protein